MHEVDPQLDPRLTDALRRLAASSQQTGPPELGAGLLNEFRRHHARRRRVRRTGIAVLGVCLAITAALVSMRDSGKKQPEIAKRPAPATRAPEQIGTTAAPPTAPLVPVAPVVQPPTIKASARLRPTRPAAAAASRAFLALPGYDPAVPMDQLNVVRVRLPESALWKMGAPIGADAGTRRVTADFVVSQDGTPYAVRLVQ